MHNEYLHHHASKTQPLHLDVSKRDSGLIFFPNSKTGWSQWWLHSQSFWKLETNIRVLVGEIVERRVFSTNIISRAVRKTSSSCSAKAEASGSHQRPCSFFLRSCPAMYWKKNIVISNVFRLFKTRSHAVVPVEDGKQDRGARRQEQHTSIRNAIQM